MYKIFAVILVSAAVSGQHHEHGHDIDYYTEPHYSFYYDVKDTHTGDIKSHKEERKGEHTQGVYMLVEPDGSKRIVEYVVEGKKGGWVPKVHREPLKLKDKHGHEGIVHANQNMYQGKVQEVIYQTHGHDSGHGYSSGSSEHSSGISHGYGSEQSSGGHKSEATGVSHDSHNSHYGHGEATSSYTFSTHGAKVYLSTKHIVPEKHGY